MHKTLTLGLASCIIMIMKTPSLQYIVHLYFSMHENKIYSFVPLTKRRKLCNTMRMFEHRNPMESPFTKP